MNSRQITYSWLISGSLHVALLSALFVIGARTFLPEFRVNSGGLNVTIVLDMPHEPHSAQWHVHIPGVPLEHQHANSSESELVIHRHAQADRSSIEFRSRRPVDVVTETAVQPRVLVRTAETPGPQELPKISSEPSRRFTHQHPTIEVDSVPLVSNTAHDDSGAIVDTLPQKLPNNPAPPYPPNAFRAGIEGRVRLDVTVDRDGTVSNVRVFESSGNQDLDESALSTVREWRFSPALRQGIPVQHVVRIPIRFSIRDRVQAP